LEGPRSLRLLADETPVIGPRDVHVRAALSGISHGTELSLYRGTSGFTDQVFDRELRSFLPLDKPGSTYPAPLGYEFVGVIAETGDQVTELSAGDLVHAGVPHREEAVLDLDGAIHMTYPLVRLPPGAPHERWLFVSLGMVALVAVHDSCIKVGDHVAVFGLGAIGLLLVQLATMAGAARSRASIPSRHAGSWRRTSVPTRCSTPARRPPRASGRESSAQEGTAWTSQSRPPAAARPCTARSPPRAWAEGW
jgi:threonine dehydrogenase-like Zn-dependent dehydrogenase